MRSARLREFICCGSQPCCHLLPSLLFSTEQALLYSTLQLLLRYSSFHLWVFIYLYHVGMDPLSISASITALLQLTSEIIRYLNAVKGAPEDRRIILSELASVSGILYVLQEQADQAKKDDQWSSTLQSLDLPEGPLHQFRRALERLSTKLAPPATPLKKLGNALVWPFQKEEIKDLLSSIERQKALLSLARQNDHM